MYFDPSKYANVSKVVVLCILNDEARIMVCGVYSLFSDEGPITRVTGTKTINFRFRIV